MVDWQSAAIGAGLGFVAGTAGTVGVVRDFDEFVTRIDGRTVSVNAETAGMFRDKNWTAGGEQIPEADMFVWNWGDGSSSTGKQASHTYSQSGEYTITLIAAFLDDDVLMLRQTVQV